MLHVKRLQRQPRQRRLYSHISRMYMCWVLLTLLALVLVQGGPSHFRVTYNQKEKKLQFECPTQESHAGNKQLLAAELSRHKDGNKIEIATYVQNKGKGSNITRKLERLEVALGVERLVANLSHVTCFDSATYVCKTNLDGDFNDDPHIALYNHTFTYTEESTKPVIEKSPLKARYNVDDVLNLTCSAITGESPQDNNNNNNAIIWEAKRQGETSFQPVSYDVHGADVKELVVQYQDCIPHSWRQMLYRLKPEDDGITFQCRLKTSNLSTQTTVALQCPVTGIVGENYVSSTDPGIEERTSSPPTSKVPQLKELPNVNTARNGRLTDEENEMKENFFSDTSLVVVVVLAVCLALVLLGMGLFMSCWRKRQMLPLVMMDSPDSSEYNDGQRHLHHPPYHPSFHHTFPVETSSSRYVDASSAPSSFFSNRTPSPSCTTNSSTTTTAINTNTNTNTHDQNESNVSIYVSMTGLDSLDHDVQSQNQQEKKKKNLLSNNNNNNNNNKKEIPNTLGRASSPEKPAAFRAPGEHDDDDDLGPNMRQDRSESIYSNQSSALSHHCDGHQLCGGKVPTTVTAPANNLNTNTNSSTNNPRMISTAAGAQDQAPVRAHDQDMTLLKIVD